MKTFLFLVCLLTTKLCFTQVNLSNGLIAYYPFSGNANSTIGSGLNGNPLNGVQLTSDRSGNTNNAFYFDGIDDVIVVNDNGALSVPAISISYQFLAESSSHSVCVGKINYQDGNGATYNTGINVSNSSNCWFNFADPTSSCVQQVNGNLFYPNVSSATVSLNQWHCVVATFESGVEKIYLDGVLVSNVTLPFSASKFCTNTNLLIGSWWKGDPRPFKGKIDEVRIYNRAVNQQEVNALCSQTTSTTCDNWLYLPSHPSYVNLGDLDIPGNKITVEATFNRTTPYSPGTGNNSDGDIVSKHLGPENTNYLIRPNHAYITTTNGFFATPDVCEIELNKNYHVAMVYDGNTLKFYRNGFLMSQVPATGDLFQNNFPAMIGSYTGVTIETMIGYIDEVRIWNVARTQAEIRTYMNGSLPNPPAQTGLRAYYTFDDLVNKQGNTTWNGTLGGSAAINRTNSNCTFLTDSCHVPVPISNIINTYTPVLGLDPCENKITVEDGSTFNAGDTVLIIQMKGAVVDSSNTAAFGTVTNYKNSGNYEFNYVKSRSGNIIELKNNLTRQYDIPAGKVQLIRVPYYTNTTVTSTLTCLPWDGSKGGVLVLNAKDKVDLAANIDVTGKGFRGGNSPNPFSNTLYCHQNNYYYAKGNLSAAAKGEGIALIGDNYAWGKGALANGGGSGNGHNSGGGGGGNSGAGGFGGYQLEPCGSAPFDNRGIGGKNIVYSNAANKIFMGGGGGSGHTDNATGSSMPGGNGGGIIIITSPVINTNGFQIKANGNNAVQCNNAANNCHDGSGGGGAGGNILLGNVSFTGTTTIDVTGGKGGDLVIYNGSNAARIGTGGGGGAGMVWFTNAALPPNITINKNGGQNGVIVQDNNNPWGATAGQPGVNLLNLVIPYDNTPFKKNIDSVKVSAVNTTCNSYNFNGFGFTNTTSVVSWQWYFGDGASANTQNTSHAYTGPGSFTVKLIVTDINGCKDSTSINVSSGGATFDFSYKQNVCDPLTVQFFDAAAAANSFWSFGDGTTSSGVINPVHTYSVPGSYIVKYTIQNNCSDTIIKTIAVNIILDNIIITPDTTICFGSTKQLRSVPSLNFCWTPATYLDDPNAANPVTSAPQNITYYLNAEITGTNLIVNGDFTNGNTGFTSAYSYATPNVTEGQYFVGANPQAWNASLSSCKDHTTAGGNMLLVNGSPAPDVNVWKQTITVSPNTNYAFSTWIQALWPPNPAQLQFSINGVTVGSLITASLPTCTWTQFYTTWNSGNNTTAVISIINKNTQVQGNDFALDDISFAPVFIKRDSVKITVDKPVVKTNNDTTICSGTQVQLNTTGAASYTWTPGSGLSNSNIANPVATASSSSTYIVSGVTTNGCTGKDTVVIATHTKPIITTSNDTTLCKSTPVQLFATGGISYAWSPATGLSGANISNPVASPSLTTNYIVTVTDANTCAYKDSIRLTIKPSPVFSVSPGQSVCPDDPKQLNASGGNYYLWQPSTFLDDPNISNPVATLNTTTTYSVTIKDSTCNDSATLSTTLTLLPLPFIKASKTNDIDCSSSFAQLTATGGIQYQWEPAASLNDPNISNPVANPLSTTLFTVSGTDNNGCTNTDTVSVYVTTNNKGGYFMPNAFSPNNDGINDCFGLKYWGHVTKLDFSIYNRFGERIFYSTDPARCWDGRFKGVLQNIGMYVFVIKATTTCDTVDRKGTFTLIR